MSRRTLSAALSLAAVVATPALAAPIAQEVETPGPTPSVTTEQPRDPRWSITTSPWEMIPALTSDENGSYFLPNVSVERDLGHDFSLQGTLGFGSLSSGTFHSPIWEIGGQARYYPVGSFRHGMDVGVQAVLVGLDHQQDDLRIIGQGMSLGAFIGYKLATRVGFTLDLQAGVQALSVGVGGSDSTTGESALATQNEIDPLLNVKFGWSF